MNIDLEVDYIADNKDKLNMIVTPIIVDSATSLPSVSSNQHNVSINIIMIECIRQEATLLLVTSNLHKV